MTFVRTHMMTLASKIVCLAATFYVSIYVARFMGPQLKGVYYLLSQIVVMLATLSLIGVDSSAIYHLGKGYDRKRVVSLSYWVTCATSVAVAGLFFYVSGLDPLKAYFAGVESRFILVVAITVPLLSFIRLNSALVMGFDRFFDFNVFNTLLFILYAVFFYMMVIVFRMGLWGALVGNAIVNGIFVLAYFLYVSRSLSRGSRNDERGVPQGLLHYGIRIFLVPVMLLLIFRVDSFMLTYFKDLTAVGVYSVALSIAELLLFVPETIGIVLFPKLANSRGHDIERRFSSILRTSLAFTALIAIAFFLLTRYLVPFIYGDAYTSSITLAYTLLPGLCAMSSYYIFSSYFQAVGRPGLVTIILSVVFIAKMLLCGILVPSYGAMGAALATSVSYVACFVLFLIAFMWQGRLNISDMVIIKSSDIEYIRESIGDMFGMERQG